MGLETRRAVKQEILRSSLEAGRHHAITCNLQIQEQCIPGLATFAGRDCTLGEVSMAECGRLSFAVIRPLMAVDDRLPGVWCSRMEKCGDAETRGLFK